MKMILLAERGNAMSIILENKKKKKKQQLKPLKPIGNY